MRSHPFAGQLYPVSRSAAEVQGVKAYPSVDALPQAADLAMLIVPAEYVPAELERCGRAGIKAAVILSSGFAEEPGERRQRACSARSSRLRSATTWRWAGRTRRVLPISRPRFAPTSAPPSDKDARAAHCLRARSADGQVSMISQSGGLGFAFFDRARPRNFRFRYIVTTGNEAVLESCRLHRLHARRR